MLKNSSQKIIMILTHDEPGGAMNLWDQVSDGLSEAGHHCATLVLYRKGIQRAENWKALCEDEQSVASAVRAIWALLRFLLAERPYALLSAQPVANIISCWFGWLCGVPVRIISHHTPVNTYGRLQRLLDKVAGCLPIVSHIVCVSDGVRNSMSGYPASYRRKLVVIKNALSPKVSNYIRDIGVHRNDCPENLQLVAAGRLAPQKNLMNLIRAMMHVEGAVLNIVGDGPLYGELRDLVIELNLKRKVVMRGALPHLEMLALMSRSDIFIQPSLFEGHSVALLEAANLQLPLVVSNVPTQVEAVTDISGHLRGLLVPVDDFVQMGKIIQYVVSNPSVRVSMRSDSRRIAEEATYERMLGLYSHLLFG